MSVLVKGMEMPECCADCKFSDCYAYPPDYDDEYVCEIAYFSMSYEDSKVRQTTCPFTHGIRGRPSLQREYPHEGRK